MRMGNQCAIKIAQPPCAPQPKGAVVVYLPPHHTPQKSTSVAGLVFSQWGHCGEGSRRLVYLWTLFLHSTCSNEEEALHSRTGFHLLFYHIMNIKPGLGIFFPRSLGKN